MKLPTLNDIAQLIVHDNEVDQGMKEGGMSEDRMTKQQYIFKGSVKCCLLEQASGFLMDLPLGQLHCAALFLADFYILLLMVLLQVDVEVVVSCSSGEGVIDTKGEELQICRTLLSVVS